MGTMKQLYCDLVDAGIDPEKIDIRAIEREMKKNHNKMPWDQHMITACKKLYTAKGVG